MYVYVSEYMYYIYIYIYIYIYKYACVLLKRDLARACPCVRVRVCVSMYVYTNARGVKLMYIRIPYIHTHTHKIQYRSDPRRIQLVGVQRSTGIIIDLNILPDEVDRRSPEQLAAELAAQVCTHMSLVCRVWVYVRVCVWVYVRVGGGGGVRVCVCENSTVCFTQKLFTTDVGALHMHVCMHAYIQR